MFSLSRKQTGIVTIVCCWQRQVPGRRAAQRLQRKRECMQTNVRFRDGGCVCATLQVKEELSGAIERTATYDNRD